MTEERNKKELDQMKQMSDTMKKTLDNLLNKVKQKLDERRQVEDNAKTEADILAKRRRLAMLRMDTSGGHQTEIAQLEKEIAEAQQNYQRNLEDQLINKLQQQADEATEQRERQIKLQESILDAVNNAQEVQELMANPMANRERLLELYKQNNNFDNVGVEEQQQILDHFETFYQGLLTNQEQQEKQREAIEANTIALRQLTQAQLGSTVDIAELKSSGINAKDAHNTYGISYEDLKNYGGYTATDFKQAGIGVRRATGAGFTLQELKANGYTVDDFAKSDVSYANARQAFSPEELLKHITYKEDAAREIQKINDERIAAEAAAAAAEQTRKEKAYAEYRDFLHNRGNKKNTGDKYWGEIGKVGLRAQIQRGAILGYSEMKVLQDLVDTSALTWEEVLHAYRQLRGRVNAAEAIKTYFGSSPSYPRRKAWQKVFGDKYPHYAAGGLATYTGPAWLDGTPSKPELILNAKDTANFIALKDVLAKAMNGIGDTSNTYGDISYEININVDKIEKDYDVDRVVEKVKKEIVKGAGYRNVTQVRSFR